MRENNVITDQEKVHVHIYIVYHISEQMTNM